MSALAIQCAHSIVLLKERFFVDSGEMASVIAILGLVLALILAHERLVNRPQHLIHVPLTDQVSVYNHQICRPRVLTFPKSPIEHYV